MEEQVYDAMGRRLRSLRNARQLTQQEIADETEIPYESYGDYERGKQRAPVGRALRLADYFQVSLDYLVGRTNHKGVFYRDSVDRNV